MEKTAWDEVSALWAMDRKRCDALAARIAELEERVEQCQEQTALMPQLWQCGGGPGVPYRYGFGYWIDQWDLLIVLEPKLVMGEAHAETVLSPIRDTAIDAILAFCQVRATLEARGE